MPLNMDKLGAVTWHLMFNIQVHLIYTKEEPCDMGGQIGQSPG